jgi:hypothetical protein
MKLNDKMDSLKLWQVWCVLMVAGIICLAGAYFASTAIADSDDYYDSLIRERPTFVQAHRAAHIVLDDYAGFMDGRVVVGPCRKVGKYSTLCRARIDGRAAQRYRILVTGTRNQNFMVAGILAR